MTYMEVKRRLRRRCLRLYLLLRLKQSLLLGDTYCQIQLCCFLLLMQQLQKVHLRLLLLLGGRWESSLLER